jgi:WD40 repeat protein
MSHLPRTLLVLTLFCLLVCGPSAAGPQPPPAADALPPGALARLGGVGLRHDGTVEGLAFAPDGKTLASVGQDGALRLWDTTTGRPRARFTLPARQGRVQRLAFSPDGKVLAFTGLDQEIHLWDAATGKPLYDLRWPSRNGMSPNFAFTPDGTKLASWANDFTIRLWDVATGRQLSSFTPNPRRAVQVMAFAPDGTTLATVSDDRTARLWDTTKGQERQRFPATRDAFYSLAVSPDGKTLATGSLHEVVLWETATGKERRRLAGYQRPVLALAFAPGGQSLSAAADDGDCRVWRVSDGQELQRVRLVDEPGVANPLTRLTLSGDGRTLAWVAWKQVNRIHLADVRTGKERLGGGQPSGGLATFAPDGKTVATPCEDGLLRLWQTASGKEVRAYGPSGLVLWLGFAPDGKTLLTVGKEVVFWDTATGKEVRRGPAPKIRFETRACALAPGGKILAVGEANYSRSPIAPKCRVVLWDLKAGKELRACQGVHMGSVTSVAFSPDGKRLASAAGNDSVRLWEVATGQEIRRWPGEGHRGTVAFADGGKSLLASSAYFKGSEDTFRVVRWELATGQERDRWEGTSPGVVNFPALFDPEGRTLACVHLPEGLDLFQTYTGKATHRLRTGRRGMSLPVAFTPDGRVLASWHGDSTVLLWDAGRPRQ